MFFLNKKKLLRDQGAGLVFRWRKARRHHSGKLLALLITSGFFAFSAYAIVLEGLRAPLLTKRTGEVVLLREGDPHCERLMLQIEDKSPFPLRWDPAYDAVTMGRVSESSRMLEGRVWDYKPTMMELPRADDSLELPSIVEQGGGYSIDLVSSWKDEETGQSGDLGGFAGDTNVSALIVADKQIHALLPAGDLPLPGAVVADEWYGQTFRFLVGIDSFGVVRGCLPLSGGSMEVAKPTDKQKLLASWLRRMAFKASEEDGGTIGVLEIQIQAREQ